MREMFQRRLWFSILILLVLFCIEGCSSSSDNTNHYIVNLNGGEFVREINGQTITIHHLKTPNSVIITCEDFLNSWYKIAGGDLLYSKTGKDPVKLSGMLKVLDNGDIELLGSSIFVDGRENGVYHKKGGEATVIREIDYEKEKLNLLQETIPYDFDWLLGTWSYNSRGSGNLKMTFYEDYSCTQNYNGESLLGLYYIDNGVLTTQGFGGTYYLNPSSRSLSFDNYVSQGYSVYEVREYMTKIVNGVREMPYVNSLSQNDDDMNKDAMPRGNDMSLSEDEMVNSDIELEVTWPDDFYWDDGYDSYAYGLENGFWKYVTEDSALVFNFNKGFTEDESVCVIEFDTEDNQLSKEYGKWEPLGEDDGNKYREFVKISLEKGHTINLEYDREHYSMLYNNQTLTYMVNVAGNQIYVNGEIDKDKASQFFIQFYDKFLNFRNDGSFTLDVQIIDKEGSSGIKPDFLNLLTEAWKENYNKSPTGLDRGPIYENNYVGLWNAKDKLSSKYPKEVIYLGNKSKYNFKVVMDYKDGPHDVLFRLVEVGGELLIDEATAAY